MAEQDFNYLFVSDFHISSGIDKRTNNYNPREDFFYDDEFYRFLHWADKNREGPTKDKTKPWELIFVGDCFDFLPVDATFISEFRNWQNRLADSLTMDTSSFLETWDEFINWSEIPDKLKAELLTPYFRNGLLNVKESPRQERKERQIKFSYASQKQLLLYEEDMDWDFGEDVSYEDATKVSLPRWASDLYRKISKEHPDDINTLYDIHPREKKGKAKPTFVYQFFRVYFKIKNKIDFGQFVQATYTQEASIQKLRTIYLGHPTFFEALTWWVAQGNKLVILAGNHDLELRWDGVQKLFKELLVTKYEECKAEGKDIKSLGKRAQKHYEKNVDFSYPWFYYKPGVFYAQHGAQYDNTNAAVNLLKPYWYPGGKERLYPSFGSIGDPIVSELEDNFPEWENVKTHGSTLSYKIKAYPYRIARIFMRNLWRYAMFIFELVINAWSIKKHPEDPKEYEDYQDLPGHEKLTVNLIRDLYMSWDKPLLLYRVLMLVVATIMILLSFLVALVNLILSILKILLSPRGGLFFVIAILLLVPGALDWIGGIPDVVINWYEGLNLTEETTLKSVIDTLIAISGVLVFIFGIFFSGIKEPLLSYLKKNNKKRFQIFLWGDDYVREGGRQTYQIFNRHVRSREIIEQDQPRYYIFGHDHEPCRVVLREEDPFIDMDAIYYFNTGAWQAWFAGDDTRRLQTIGKDVQYTFLKISEDPAGSAYTADLLQWNDEAGRPDEQIVIETKDDDDPIVRFLKSPIVSIIELAAAVGLIIGFIVGGLYWLWGLLIGIAVGGIIGGLYHRWIKKENY